MLHGLWCRPDRHSGGRATKDMGGFSEYRRKKAAMLSAAKRLRVEDRGSQERRSARVGRGAEDGTVASDRGLPTRGWQVSVTEPVAGSRRGLSKPLVAGEPILKRSDRREATSDRRRAGGYGAADGAPIAWDAADDLPMHPRTRGGSSRGASSPSAFPSCAALVTGVALVMMIAVCALAVVHPDLARAGATHAAAAWTGRVSSFVSSFRREAVDTRSARLAFLAPHGHDARHHDAHRHAQKTATAHARCEALSVEEAAARVADAFAEGESIGAACEAAKRFRWDDVDPYVDAAVKDRVGDDEGKVVVFHAGSRFDPDAVTRAAEMMARDDEVDPKVSLGEGSAGAEKRKEKSGAAHEGKKEKSGAAHEGKKENALPLPGGGDEPPPRPTGNLTAPPSARSAATRSGAAGFVNREVQEGRGSGFQRRGFQRRGAGVIQGLDEEARDRGGARVQGLAEEARRRRGSGRDGGSKIARRPRAGREFEKDKVAFARRRRIRGRLALRDRGREREGRREDFPRRRGRGFAVRERREPRGTGRRGEGEEEGRQRRRVRGEEGPRGGRQVDEPREARRVDGTQRRCARRRAASAVREGRRVSCVLRTLNR